MKTFPLEEIQLAFQKLVEEREWQKFHTPKNLSMALAGESAELLELFQWLTEEESWKIMQDAKKAQAVKHELADILLYLIRLSDVLKVDLTEAVVEKLKLNQAKYPVHLSRGSAKKYTEFEKS